MQTNAALLTTMTLGYPEIQTRAGNLGAVEVVVAAMLAHPRSRLVQFQACGALGAMAQGHAANLARAGNAGALEAVNAAMTNHYGIHRVAASLVPLLGGIKRKR